VRQPVPCSILSVALLFILGNCSAARAADEWTQFRGPDGSGHSTAVGLPVTWSETENVAWKAPVPGSGHSSPVISGNQIWLTAAVETPLTEEEQKQRLSKLANPNGLVLAGALTLRALCFDRGTGELLQNVELLHVREPEPKHALNSYASPSPVLKEGRLYCHFGAYGTACVDTSSGQVLWRSSEHQVDHQNGPGSSPVLWGNRLIIAFDGIDQQYVAALDTDTGMTAWKTMRSGEVNPRADFQKAYGTGSIVESGGRAQIIVPGADWVYSYDPATGKELWKAAYGMLGFSTVPRPVFANGLAFISTSYMQPRLLAVRYDGSGDVTKTHVAWQLDGQFPQKPSMLTVGDDLYLINDKGIAMCLETGTGKEVWKQRLGGQYSASPLFADGRIHFFSQEGQTFVVRPRTADAPVEVLAENTLDSGFMASPAVAGKALFLRSETSLYRIEVR